MKDTDIKVYNIIDFLKQIDYYSIFGVLTPGIISYVSNNPKFHKNKKVTLDKERIIRKELGRIIIDFLDVINENIEELNPTIIINNFNNLVIKYTTFENDKRKSNRLITGAYCPGTNQIELSKDNYMLTIFHELFHTASTYIDYVNEEAYTGFEYIHDGIVLAEGLNEGYTQYLTEKYFGDRNIMRSYQYEKRIAEVLESIIGVKRMQWCYFNASLSGLIHDLKKYSPYEDIIDFLKALDYITNNIHQDTITEEMHEQIQQKLDIISEFLVRVIARQNLSGKTGEELDESIESAAPIIAKIPKSIKINDVSHELLNLETIKRCASEVIEVNKLVRIKK